MPDDGYSALSEAPDASEDHALNDIPFLALKRYLERSGRVPSSKLFWASRRVQLAYLAREFEVDLGPMLQSKSIDVGESANLSQEDPPESQKPSWLPKCLESAHDVITSPPVWLELGLKMLITLVLFGGAIAGFVIALVLVNSPGFDATSPWTQVVPNATGVSQVQLTLSGCDLAVGFRAGSSGIVLTDTSLQHRWLFSQNLSSRLSITYTPVTGCGEPGITVRCDGPSAEAGIPQTAYLEIGTDLAIDSLVASIGPARSSLRVRDTPPLRSVSVSASATAIVGLEDASIDTLTVVMIDGLLELNNVSLTSPSTADLGVGALSAQLPPLATTRLVFPSTAYASGTSDGLCLSDAARGPPQLSSADGSVLFAPLSAGDISAAGATVAAQQLTLTYATGAGPFHVSRALPFGERVASNTYDASGGTARYTLEPAVNAWAETMRNSAGMQLIRMRLIGPGLPVAVGGAEGGAEGGEWLYSLHNRFYLWHMPAILWLSTAALFAPKIARHELLLKTTQCLAPNAATAASTTAAASTAATSTDANCAATSAAGTTSGGVLGADALGQLHAMIIESVPTFSVNASAAIYFIAPQTGTPGMGLIPFFAPERVTSFAVSDLVDSAVAYQVSATRTGEDLLDVHAVVFIAMGYLLRLIIPLLATIIVARIYHQERDEIIAAEGPHLWPRLARFSLTHIPGVESATSTTSATATATAAAAPSATSASTTIDGAAASAEPADDGVQIMEFKALHVLRESTLFFVVVDTVINQNYARRFTVDGLLSASRNATMHFAIVALLCVPLTLVALLQMHSVINQQLGCSVASSVWRGRAACQVDGWLGQLPNICFVVCLAFVSFMLLYALVDELERYVDILFPPPIEQDAASTEEAPSTADDAEQPSTSNGAAAATPAAAAASALHRRAGVSSARRLLVRLRSHWAFTCTFGALFYVVIYTTCFFATCFGIAVMIAATVEPTRMLPVLLALIGSVVLAHTTFQNLKRVQTERIAALRTTVTQTMSQTVGSLRGASGGVRYADALIAETLRSAGFSTGQIAIFTVIIMLAGGACFAYVVLGCFFFMDANSIIPALVSSVVVISSSLVALQRAQGGTSADSEQNINALTTALTSSLTNIQTSVSNLQDVSSTALVNRVRQEGTSSYEEVRQGASSVVSNLTQGQTSALAA